MVSSLQDEFSSLSEDDVASEDEASSHRRFTSSNEVSTDSHYEPSMVDSDSEREETPPAKPVAKPANRVYSVALLLRIQAIVAACSPPPASHLITKRNDELLAIAPLHKKEKRSTPWTAAENKQGSKPRSSDDKMSKAARSALASLSADRVDQVCDKLAQSGLHTTPQLVVVLREIAEKAVAHHQLIPACAELCVRLKSDSRFVSAAGPEGGPLSYRQLLLDECWPRYQMLLEVRDVEPSDQDLRKKQALGNMKLMGDLITRGLMSPRLLVDCAEALVNHHLEHKTIFESLEALVALLMAGCAHVDRMPVQAHAARLNSVFSQIHIIAHDQAVPLSLRLLLRDVLSLHESGWRRGASFTSTKANEEIISKKMELKVSLRSQLEDNKQRQAPQPIDVATSTAKQSMLSLAREMLPATASPPNNRAARPGPPAPPKPPPAPRTGAGSAPVMTASLPVPVVAPVFDPKAFHRELSATLRDLACTGDSTAAVRRIRAQKVPKSHQAREFTDLLTRACEAREAARQSAFAFAAGLATSAFDRSECLAGVGAFFLDVYDDLCEEVPQLPAIVEREMMPVLGSVYSFESLEELLPESLQA